MGVSRSFASISMSDTIATMLKQGFIREIGRLGLKVSSKTMIDSIICPKGAEQAVDLYVKALVEVCGEVRDWPRGP